MAVETGHVTKVLLHKPVWTAGVVVVVVRLLVPVGVAATMQEMAAQVW